MRRRGYITRVGLLILLLCAVSTPLHTWALDPPAIAAPANLAIAEIKMTGNEFVVLQNNTGADIADLSSYALYYFNNYNPFAPGVSSSVKALPALGLAAGQSLVLSSDGTPTCGAAAAADLGMSLGDSSGFLEIVHLGQTPTGAVTQEPGDVVSWSSGQNGTIQNVPSSSKDSAAMWYRYETNGTYAWQLADMDGAHPCQLNAIMQSNTPPTPTSGQLVSADADIPGTIVRLATGGPAVSVAGIPAADAGLRAPQVSELLPDAVGSDSTDEFIELYNPNATVFDLSGFVLQTGSTTSATRHNYVFPAGTTLPAKTFKAFYSRDTGLSLSNTGGQVWLLDPLTTAIGQSEVYAKPKSGSAWAAVGKAWYFTTTPTPGAANSVKQTNSTTAKATTVAKTTKGTPVTTVAAKSAGVVAGASTTAAYDTAAKTTSIHPATLAVVVGLALLYGAYEYRHDIANRYRQLREHRSARG